MSERKNAAKKNQIKRNLEAYTFMIPNLILFLSCSVYPVLWALKYVFYQYGGYGWTILREYFVTRFTGKVCSIPLLMALAR